MKITRLLHASVNVHGALDPSARWYREFLGLEGTERPEIPGIPGAWFSLDGTQVHLVGGPPEGTAIDPTGPHFCFGVEDLDQAVAELDSLGTPYRRAQQGDIVQIWIADPAGNTVELQQDRPL